MLDELRDKASSMSVGVSGGRTPHTKEPWQLYQWKQHYVNFGVTRTVYSNVCAFNCNSSKSNIVPVTGSLAFITNERMSCFSCFCSICLRTKSAVYFT